MNNAPIGVFDSGMGGLSVWKEIVAELPHESTIYFGDGAGCPYGGKSQEEIIRLSDAIVRFFIEKHVKLIVVACNTATAAAIDHLRAKYPDLPFVGMEPAVKVAAERSCTGAIGILATATTLGGRHFRETSERYGDRVRIAPAVGEGFVELVEAGREDSPEAEAAARAAIEPLLAAGIDQLVLGCTHYPFMAPAIEKALAGRAVTLVDPAPAVARRTAEVLAGRDALAGADHPAKHEFFSSADEAYLGRLRERGERILAEQRQETKK